MKFITEVMFANEFIQLSQCQCHTLYLALSILSNALAHDVPTGIIMIQTA